VAKKKAVLDQPPTPVPQPSMADPKPRPFNVREYFDPIEEYIQGRFDACPEGHRKAFTLYLNHVASRITTDSGLDAKGEWLSPRTRGD
jgi:hypothetical protein